MHRRLSEKLTSPIEDRLIKIDFFDSGFRPGKKESLPIHRVYEFCRKHKLFVFATKGSSTPMARPLIESAIDVTGVDGKSGRTYYDISRAFITSAACTPIWGILIRLRVQCSVNPSTFSGWGIDQYLNLVRFKKLMVD